MLGLVVATFSAAVAIKWLVAFLTKHGFCVRLVPHRCASCLPRWSPGSSKSADRPNQKSISTLICSRSVLARSPRAVLEREPRGDQAGHIDPALLSARTAPLIEPREPISSISFTTSGEIDRIVDASANVLLSRIVPRAHEPASPYAGRRASPCNPPRRPGPRARCHEEAAGA